jgi:hypothetical protein
VRLAVEEGFVTRRLSLAILKKHGEDTEEVEAGIAEVEKNYKKLNAHYYINLGGAYVVYLIVLWKVFTTLLA